ncbi:DUF3488 and transglutaminase-like domain-containing protein [Microbacterium capsulatum]|uniref:DUF3488 and transglutaminase-like domain-containing protein n=1 Tax=Microbacterium capsulatum TaxID=3041921 RepID=A0ABU0XGW2_9MICO|nr:DUF3488 and transglutaminase-like domain-containing protein [Microbacterium sp. ASV81]MDQ4214362.1 DUF3488 and transglutaminase-like domain-containing protein [Microbacterium sp. ASV81]
MSASEPDTKARPESRAPAGPVTAAVLSALGLFVAVWPVSGVLRPGSWSAGAASVGGAVILAGLVVRLLTRRSPAWLAAPAVPVAQILAGAVALTVFTSRTVGSFRFVPTPGVFRTVGALLGQAAEEIRRGTAPLTATSALAVGAAVAAGILAVLIDLVLVTLRTALPAGLLPAVVGAIPGIVVHSEVNPVWFIVAAVVILAFLHVRFAPPGSAHRRAPVAARTRTTTTVTVGAFSLVAALTLAPVLPLSAAGIDTQSGGTTTLNASLALGQDLRRPQATTALTLISQDGSVPYLRIATLSDFDGVDWLPDRPVTVPLTKGFGAVTTSGGVEQRSTRTTIRTTGISGSLLPVPYQATGVRGMTGLWTAAPDNRTLVAANADAADQNYTVDTTVVAPTLDQIRASTASGSGAPEALRLLPKNLPPIIAEDAKSVTGDSPTDYDRLIALQTWFRAGFRYSLKTPVAGGFDGTNADAVATFLTVREGYCVHFAGAFALMARSLGMPTRIVVGYLPGSATDRRSDGHVVYVVSSDQLHAWPEVFFQGIGWVPFEPTATRGVPTAFENTTTSDNGTGTAPAGGATPAPTSSSRVKDPSNIDIPNAGAAGAATTGPMDPRPVLWTILAAVVVLLVPAIVRRVQRAVRMSRAGRGDAIAAWTELRATLQDLGLPAPESESPRRRGVRLVRERGVDAEAVAALVGAVERSSYAPPGEPVAGDLRRPLAGIRAELRRGMPARNRIGAVLAPRSLLGARLAATTTA